MGRTLALSRAEEFTFTCAGDGDVPEPDRPRFRCRPLSGAERHTLQESMAEGRALGDVEGGPDLAAVMRASRRAAELALVGWENLTDEAGGKVPFPGHGPRAVGLLPTAIVQEIGGEVIRRSLLPHGASGN